MTPVAHNDAVAGVNGNEQMPLHSGFFISAN